MTLYQIETLLCCERLQDPQLIEKMTGIPQ
jgi:hypothetical protein